MRRPLGSIRAAGMDAFAESAAAPVQLMRAIALLRAADQEPAAGLVQPVRAIAQLGAAEQTRAIAPEQPVRATTGLGAANHTGAAIAETRQPFPADSPRVVPLILVGYGGHGRVVRDIAEATGRFAVIAVADDKFGEPKRREDGLLQCPIDCVPELLQMHDGSQLVVAIGVNLVRRDIVERLALPAECYARLLHPGAHVSPRATVAPGTVVMPGAVVNAGARIGAHAIVNSGAVVEHDAAVGAYAHLSPNAAIAGGVAVGEGAHLGIGSAVIPAVDIGEWSVLGAGAAAVSDIPPRVVAVGVPAKVRRALS